MAEKKVTTTDMMERLQAPFPPELIKTKSAGGKRQVPYAEVWVYQQRMDDVFGFGWTASTERLEGGDCLCTLTVTLPDGSQVSREAYGEKNNAFGGAEAQAFKRACSAFGVGRFLYGLESAPSQQTSRNGQAPAKATPQNGNGQPSVVVATTAQMKKIHAMGRADYGDSWDESREQIFAHFTGSEKRPLSKDEASAIIDGLEARAAEREAAPMEDEVSFD